EQRLHGRCPGWQPEKTIDQPQGRAGPGRAGTDKPEACDRRDRRSATLQRRPRCRRAADRLYGFSRTGQGLRRGAVRHPGVQPLGARGAEKCHRRRFAALWQKCLGRQTGRGDQCLTGRDWRFWRQSPFTPVAGVSRRAMHATAGSLSGRRGWRLRRRGSTVGVGPAVPAKLYRCLWAMGRALQEGL
ncbi:Chromate reductase (EC 1.6.5.2), partial [Pseudomonas sp. FEN]